MTLTLPTDSFAAKARTAERTVLVDTIPGQDALIAILSADNAPPHIILDIGGSADINGDGLVKAHLDEAGALVFEDA